MNPAADETKTQNNILSPCSWYILPRDYFTRNNDAYGQISVFCPPFNVKVPATQIIKWFPRDIFVFLKYICLMQMNLFLNRFQSFVHCANTKEVQTMFSYVLKICDSKSLYNTNDSSPTFICFSKLENKKLVLNIFLLKIMINVETVRFCNRYCRTPIWNRT